MSTKHAAKAAILGGGIGGLTAANTLVRSGWHVEVFERAEGLPPTGTTLGLWPEALTALEVAGLGGRAEKLGVLQTSGSLLRWDGRPIAHLENLRRSALLLSRPPLLNLLAGGLPSDTVQFGQAAPPLPDLSGYDVVIGADGIGSATRDAVFGTRYRPVYTGFTAWRGWVDGATDSLSESWGPGSLFGISPRDGELTNWFAAVRAPAESTGGVPELRERFQDWHPAVVDVLDRLDPPTVLHHDLYESPPLPSFVRGKVALIGDAAHAMAPNLGRGACEAMVDASVLAVLLSEHPVAEALQRYDRARRRRTQRLVRASRMLAGVATATRFTAVRNAAVRATSRFA